MSQPTRAGRAALALAGAASLLAFSPLASLAQSPAAPSGAPATVSEACLAPAIDGLLKHSGRLTVSTDNPAFPPWFEGAVPQGSEWADYGGYPPSGEGFESAMVYAIAAALGFGADQVDWLGQAAFGLAFEPGPKDFDFHVGQVEATPARAEVVDFSGSYYELNQSLIALADNPIVGAASIADLKGYSLGSEEATTGYDFIVDHIAPTQEPKPYTDTAGAIQALAGGLVDGLVVDLPTAMYIRDGELEDYDTPEPESVIVGQFETPVQGYLGTLQEKGSPLTACIDEAIAAIRASGQWQQIHDAWLKGTNEPPFLR